MLARGALNTKGHRPPLHWGLLAAMTVTWGSAPALAKVSLATITPFVTVAGRLWLAALILLALMRLRDRRLPRAVLPWAFFAVLGLTGNALPFALIMYGQLEVPSGLTAVCFSAMPIATLLLAAATIPEERLTVPRLAGFAVALVGILVLLAPSLAGIGAAPPLLSLLAILAGALCYAVGAVTARFRPPMDALVSATGTVLMGALFITPPALWSLLSHGFAPAPASLATLLALGVFSTVIPTLAFFQLVTLAGPAFLSLINYLIPVWGFLLGVTLMGEALRPSALLALLLLLAGIVFAGRPVPPVERPAPARGA